MQMTGGCAMTGMLIPLALLNTCGVNAASCTSSYLDRSQNPPKSGLFATGHFDRRVSKYAPGSLATSGSTSRKLPVISEESMASVTVDPPVQRCTYCVPRPRVARCGSLTHTRLSGRSLLSVLINLLERNQGHWTCQHALHSPCRGACLEDR
jgi:hypothetical protein